MLAASSFIIFDPPFFPIILSFFFARLREVGFFKPPLVSAICNFISRPPDLFFPLHFYGWRPVPLAAARADPLVAFCQY